MDQWWRREYIGGVPPFVHIAQDKTRNDQYIYSSKSGSRKGVEERSAMANCLMNETKPPRFFWNDVTSTGAYLCNRRQYKAVGMETSQRRMFGKDANIFHLTVLRSRVRLPASTSKGAETIRYYFRRDETRVQGVPRKGSLSATTERACLVLHKIQHYRESSCGTFVSSSRRKESSTSTWECRMEPENKIMKLPEISLRRRKRSQAQRHVCRQKGQPVM